MHPAMATVVSSAAQAESSSTVVHCYDFFDRVFPECGIFDYTEGIYHGDAATEYEQAQRNQHTWLLDAAGCTAGSRLLDIGCGKGTLHTEARERGAEAVGITISPAQVKRGAEMGRDIRLHNYRNLGEEWNGRFDCVVANGSAEHFVQQSVVLAGRADELYEEFFATCHRVLDPRSASQRLVTTIIHTNEHTPPLTAEERLAAPWAFPWFSLKFHYALVQRGFGGNYPDPGQLERCARRYFQLVEEVDGTHDYHLTSEAWFRRVKRSLLHWRRGPRIAAGLAGLFLRQPRQTATLVFGLLVAESWQRQFRGPTPPTTLLRQVWRRIP